MPFQKGNKLAAGIKSGGRKGFEYEQAQLKKMRKLLNGLFGLAGKIQGGEATAKQVQTFNTLLKLNLKIMDKLHANREKKEITGAGGLPFKIIIVKDDSSTKEGKDSKAVP